MTPIDFNGLDTTVHGPIRLGIMTALQIDGPLSFTAVKKRLEAHDGSLGLHLKRLEEAGYISGKKAFVGRRPKTTYRLTTAGRKALANYLNMMRDLLDSIEEAKTKGGP